MIRSIIMLLIVAGCTAVAHPTWMASSKPPYSGCLPKPEPLPSIATVDEIRARHDALDKLYDDCALRTLRNAQAFEFYIRR